MKLRKPAIFFLGLVAGLVPVGFGVDTVPSNIRVVLPAEMAARLAQDSLGQPLPNGDSRVTIPVKKPINATVKKVLIKKLPDAVKSYGSKIFKLNFEEPFKLDIRIFGLKPAGDVRIKSLRFSEAPRADNRVLIDVDMEIRRLNVATSEIWVVERGLTPGNSPAQGVGCPVEKSKMDSFVKHQVGARVVGATIRAKQPGADETPISVQGRFEAHYAPAKPGAARELQLRALSVRHNVASVVNSSYRLDAQLQVPPVIVFLEGECYPDPTGGKAINELFQGMLDSIKQQVVKGVSETITQTALKEATKAFAKLKIPVEKEVVAYTREYDVLEIPQIVNLPVSTYVAPRYRIPPVASAEVPPKAGPKNSKLPKDLIWNINERLLLGGLGANAQGGLGLELGDQLTLNARTEAAVQPASEGAFPTQESHQLRIVFNRSFFASKVNLVESLRAEQRRMLPAGIVLAEKGIDVRPNSGSRISVVPHVEVHLKQLPGIAGLAASLIERFAGNTDGIYRVPLQLDLRPEVIAIGGDRFLRLHLAVYENLIENQFGDRSNLDDANRLIYKLVKKKLLEAAAKIKANPIDIDLGPLEAKAPLKLDRVVFSDRGSLAVDLQILGIRGLIKKKPVDASAQKAIQP